jgi:anti-anti-sigma regulatory factor
MLRITADTAVDGIQRFRLDGRLTEASVPEVAGALEPSLRSAALPVTLDVSGLTYLDAEGARFLRQLSARDVNIRGCSSFVAKLLGLT